MLITFFDGGRAQQSCWTWLDEPLFKIREVLERVPDQPTIPEGQVALLAWCLRLPVHISQKCYWLMPWTPPPPHTHIICYTDAHMSIIIVIYVPFPGSFHSHKLNWFQAELTGDLDSPPPSNPQAQISIFWKKIESSNYVWLISRPLENPQHLMEVESVVLNRRWALDFDNGSFMMITLR